MRKIFVLTLVVSMGLPALLHAQGGNHPMAGCGLGYVLFGNSDNSPVMQILAATTNGTSGNQTFGMTTGTSGCTEDGAVKFVKEAEVFAEVNLDSLRRDIASGEGEYVNSFATLLGASDSQVPQMIDFLHDHYSQLFPSADVTSGELMSNIQALL